MIEGVEAEAWKLRMRMRLRKDGVGGGYACRRRWGRRRGKNGEAEVPLYKPAIRIKFLTFKRERTVDSAVRGSRW